MNGRRTFKVFSRTVLVLFTLLSSVAAIPVSSDAQPPGLARAIEVQDRYNPQLMKTPLVVGTAVGLTPGGQPVIKVFAQSHGASLPPVLDGVTVVPEVTGMFTARQDPNPRDRFPRPVPIGVSTGHPDVTAGTIGARVRDAQGNVYALSNNHVYANTNDASVGDNVLQPGSIDGGTDPQDRIGSLYAFVPIDFDGGSNYVDAAIASTRTDLVGYYTPSFGYGTPSAATVTASLTQPVQKFGRTTGWTQGEVSGINATIDVCYEAKCNPVRCICRQSARFVDQIVIIPGTFSSGGDSGSLIVTDDENKNPVGLLFAGSDVNTIANPIDQVLDSFDVEIDDGSGGGGNMPPTASFVYECTDLSCQFNASGSDDPEGSISSYDWNFGDGNTGSGVTTSHTYSAGDTYTVALTVTDEGGATDTESQSVTVSSGGGITLTATGHKVKGRHHVDLTWSGATSSNVDVYRDGAPIKTTANDGAYTDATNNVGGGSYTYEVCEEGTTTCSNEVTVNF
jgi:PKD repeat protein